MTQPYAELLFFITILIELASIMLGCLFQPQAVLLAQVGEANDC